MMCNFLCIMFVLLKVVSHYDLNVLWGELYPVLFWIFIFWIFRIVFNFAKPLSVA